MFGDSFRSMEYSSSSLSVPMILPAAFVISLH